MLEIHLVCGNSIPFVEAKALIVTNLQSSLYLAHDENKNDRRVQFGW
jgi:hypothetical protein